MEIMKDQLVKKIMESDVRGVRLRGRGQMGWIDDVKRQLNERGMFVEQGRMIVRDRSECLINDVALTMCVYMYIHIHTYR